MPLQLLVSSLQYATSSISPPFLLTQFAPFIMNIHDATIRPKYGHSSTAIHSLTSSAVTITKPNNREMASYPHA
jgi:hypothetical protein